MTTSRNIGIPMIILVLFLSSFCLLIVPLPVGCSADTQLGAISSDVDTQIEQLVTSNVIPSFQAGIVLNGGLVWAKGYGALPALDTVFMIGSITKTFTATAVLQLYERNLIDLDDDINDYLPFSVRNPDYPSSRVTIAMLLTHTSGLGSELPYILSWSQSTELSEWMNRNAGYNTTVWDTRPSLGEFLNDLSGSSERP
jgi:CubicO group peptidase (beta-lactamase class C family)